MHGPGGKGRGAPLRAEGRRLDLPRRIEVEHREVGRITLFEPSAAQAEEPARIHRHEFHETLERDDAPPHEVLVEQREGALEPHDAHGAAGQAAQLLLGHMGCMVRGDDLDRAVLNAGDERRAVLAAADRRVHLEAPLLAQLLVAEQQVVRRRLAAHAQPPGPGLPHQLDTLPRRDVADVVPAPGAGRQLDVAFDLPPLALGRDAAVAVFAAVDAVVDVAAVQQLVDLAVGHDRLVKGRGAAHRLLHEFGGLHAAPVIREADDLGCQRLQVGQGAAAALSLRDAAVWQHAHHGVAADQVGLHAQRLQRIGRRIEVGHGADRGVAAACGGGGAGGDGLLLRKARLAQVHMHVHKPRDDPQSPQADDAVVGARRAGGDDASLLDGQRPLVEAAAAVDPGSYDQAPERKKIGQPKNSYPNKTIIPVFAGDWNPDQ